MSTTPVTKISYITPLPRLGISTRQFRGPQVEIAALLEVGTVVMTDEIVTTIIVNRSPKKTSPPPHPVDTPEQSQGPQVQSAAPLGPVADVMKDGDVAAHIANKGSLDNANLLPNDTSKQTQGPQAFMVADHTPTSSTPKAYQLEQWAHQALDSCLTFTERLEKSKWEAESRDSLSWR